MDHAPHDGFGVDPARKPRDFETYDDPLPGQHGIRWTDEHACGRQVLDAIGHQAEIAQAHHLALDARRMASSP
jgi:hypothetical protein